jgi:hypothetical protein
MGHRMVEPESNFRSRMKQFVFEKDVTGLLEKTKQYHIKHAPMQICQEIKVAKIIVAAGHWPFQTNLSRIFTMLFINVCRALRYCGMNDFKCFTRPQLNT